MNMAKKDLYFTRKKGQIFVWPKWQRPQRERERVDKRIEYEDEGNKIRSES